jgi:DNA-binding LytR/AlgR family response regulator
MNINCVIVDDEHLARTLLEDYISKLSNLNLIASFSGAPQANDLLQGGSVDLLFLDVQMPDVSGIDFLKSLQQKPVVIFTTACPDYALDGYALDVLDYLLKPIPFDRFLQAVNKATKHIVQLKPALTDTSLGFILLKSEHRLHKVNYDNILYIEGLKEYVIFYLKQGSRIVTLEALKNLEKKLPPNFMRVHRSHIINKNDVSSLYGNMIEIGGKKITIGKTYKDLVISQLFIEKQ